MEHFLIINSPKNLFWGLFLLFAVIINRLRSLGRLDLYTSALFAIDQQPWLNCPGSFL